VNIININNSDDLKSYIKSKKFLKNLYIREIYSSLHGYKTKKTSLIIFLIKSWAFLFYHFLIVFRRRNIKLDNQILYLSPDHLFDKDLKFHKYWELIPKYHDIKHIDFIFFSNIKDRLFSKSKGISNSIDSYFSIKSFIKLFLIVLKLNILLLNINLDLFFKKIKSAKYLSNIYNLGTLNDYFIYFLLSDFSNHKDNVNKSIYLAGEFQFWELGLFKNYKKNRFLYQHSGIRFNDSRISFFKEKNKDLNILVTNNAELDYLKSIGFTELVIEKNFRSSDLWIKVSDKTDKLVFFGSLDIDLDIKILTKLNGNISYKPHPSIPDKFMSFDKIWIDTKEEITPIVYAQSAMSKNLLDNNVRCKVIFKNNFDMSLIKVKSIIEKSKNTKSKIFNDYSLIEL
tara:strand:+ start:577 stop:1770 length:1194 start_codon:yes stop_codon:yes gene_type:complete